MLFYVVSRRGPGACVNNRHLIGGYMNQHLQRLLCGAIAFVGTTAAMAQASAGGGASDGTQAQTERQVLSEVVVSARKRDESLQNVPVTVSPISAVQLENNNATDLSKVGELAPQVLIGRATNGTGGFLTIRGISSSATDAGLDQSVAVSIDGVPLSRGRIITSTVFDMRQIEILQGPQALFFGKNSPAGVISMHSNDPTDSVEASVKTGFEFKADERFVEGVLSGPITNTLKARLALHSSQMTGWIRNVAGPLPDPLRPTLASLPGAVQGITGPGSRELAGRVTLAWAPAENFNANLKLTYDKERLNAMDAYVEMYCLPPRTVPVIAGRTLPGADCDKNMVKAESAAAPYYIVNFPHANGGVPYADSKVFLAALNLNWKFNNSSLTSTTGYYKQLYSGTNTADFSPLALIWSSQVEKYELLTQELRFNTDFSGPVNVMGGAYFEHSRRPWANYPDVFHGGLNTTSNNWASWENAAYVKTESYSAFAQVRWNITPTTELAAGARYTNDKKDGDFVNNSIGVTSSSLLPAGTVLSPHYSNSNVSPEVTFAWHPAPKQTLYVGYKTGYKSGGLSTGATITSTATVDNLKFGPEKSKGFELGYKSDLLQDTLRLDVTAYSYKYDGLQLASFFAPTISFNIGNAAAARTEGVTASTEWLATNSLTFSGNLGYNRARFLDYRDAPCYSGQTAALGCVGAPAKQDLTGTAPVRAPNLTFNLGADYKRNLAAGWTADFSIDGTHTSSYQTATDNAPGGMQDGFWRLNAAVHLMTASEKFRISLIGRNLNNSYTMIVSTNLPGGTPDEFIATFDRPREIALQAEYRF
jgi:iron complex outermembrane recepter protein